MRLRALPLLPALALLAPLSLAPMVATPAAAQSRASLLHDALHLQGGQEDAWRAFQAAVTPDPQSQAQARQTAQMAPTLPTPRRLALVRAQMQADLESYDRTARAVNAFYAVLNPDQQRTFDRQTAQQGAGQQSSQGR